MTEQEKALRYYENLTNLSEGDKKSNPNHDELGRFASEKDKRFNSAVSFCINFLGMRKRMNKPFVTKDYLFEISPNTFNLNKDLYLEIISYLLKEKYIGVKNTNTECSEIEYYLTTLGSEIIRKKFIDALNKKRKDDDDEY